MVKLAMRSGRGDNFSNVGGQGALTGCNVTLPAVCSIADKFPKADVWKVNAEQTYHEAKNNG